MIHLCHAIDCSERITPKLLMCPRHWYMVPAALRKQVWQTYRPGQEVDKCPSKEYLEVAKQAINLVAIREGKPPISADIEVIKTLELMLAKSKNL